MYDYSGQFLCPSEKFSLKLENRLISTEQQKRMTVPYFLNAHANDNLLAKLFLRHAFLDFTAAFHQLINIVS